MSNTKIHYLKDKNDNYLLPFQYYNSFNLINIPMFEKKPIIKDWPNKTKTIPPNYINNNIGILTGKINNIIVLDIDIKDDGMKFWNIIKNNYNDIITPLVKSPGGSLHYYFKYDKDIPNTIRIKIDNKRIGWDIKSDKSIITSPPSIYPNTNKKYKWLIKLDDTKIKKMPIWLKKYILDHLK